MKIKYLINLLVLLVIFVLQTTFLNHLKIMTVKPDLLLVYIVCTAFINGEYEGSFYGALVGLVQDCLFCDFIGFNLCLYTLCGFFGGMVSKFFYKENCITPVISVVVLTFLFNLMYFMLFVLTRDNTDILYFFKNIIIPMVIYNGIFTLPLYAISYFINEYMSINNLGRV